MSKFQIIALLTPIFVFLDILFGVIVYNFLISGEIREVIFGLVLFAIFDFMNLACAIYCYRKIRNMYVGENDDRENDYSSPLFRNKRERLALLFTIKTDKSTYLIYNTQTISNDALNVEIEKNGNEIILEKVLIDEACGTMGGDSFYSFVCTMLRILSEYIVEKGEVVIESVDHKDSGAFNQFSHIYNFSQNK